MAVEAIGRKAHITIIKGIKEKARRPCGWKRIVKKAFRQRGK